MFICNQQNKEFSQFLIEFAKETLLANVGVLCRNLSATYGGEGGEGEFSSAVNSSPRNTLK